MMELLWTPEAIRDRDDIYDYIEADNPLAALDIDDLISDKAAMLKDYPKLGKTGRVPGTFELVINSNYMIVYDIVENRVRILNIVHNAQHWPPL